MSWVDLVYIVPAPEVNRTSQAVPKVIKTNKLTNLENKTRQSLSSLGNMEAPGKERSPLLPQTLLLLLPVSLSLLILPV